MRVGYLRGVLGGKIGVVFLGRCLGLFWGVVRQLLPHGVEEPDL